MLKISLTSQHHAVGCPIWGNRNSKNEIRTVGSLSLMKNFLLHIESQHLRMEKLALLIETVQLRLLLTKPVFEWVDDQLLEKPEVGGRLSCHAHESWIKVVGKAGSTKLAGVITENRRISRRSKTLCCMRFISLANINPLEIQLNITSFIHTPLFDVPTIC